MSGAIHTWRELSSTPSRHVRKRLSDRASHNPIVALPHPLIPSAMGLSGATSALYWTLVKMRE